MSIVLAKLEIVGWYHFLMVGPVFFIFYSNIQLFYSATLNFFDTWFWTLYKNRFTGSIMDGIMILTSSYYIFQDLENEWMYSSLQGRYHFVSHIRILYSSNRSSKYRSVDWRQKYWFYFLFFVILTFMLINTNKKTRSFLYVWGVFSILVTLKGIGSWFWGWCCRTSLVRWWSR
jgi:hypothetical protein